jgi:ATP/maltotriose-dependent transcriptional regulator MalT/DNA-binding SARP family transcriptional activator
VRSDRIARLELARRLTRALDAGAVVLVAPAGYGKTMALEAALELRGGGCAWVRCTEADRDPGRLLGHLVDALRSAAPGVADAFADRLAAGNEPVDVGRAARALAAELSRLLVDPLAIVIDDAERLGGAPAALRLVGDLLGADAPRLAVAVAARVAPRLRLAKLRASGRLTELDAAALAFTVEECAELLRRQGSREPAEALWSAAEGWPLGVALAARSASAATAARPGTLHEYLAEEVLDHLQPSLRDALADASVAPRLDAATVAALGLPASFLDAARAAGIPLREVGDGVELHPLVREFLAARLERERPPARRAELHARLAATLSGPEAVEHWLAAGEDERAAAAVAMHAPALLRTAPATVAAWLERLPASARAAPELRLLEGRLLAGAGRLADAIAPLRQAVDGFAARGDAQSEWLARAGLAATYVIQERFEDAIPLAAGLDATDAHAAPMVGLAVGAALAGACRYAEAADQFRRAVDRPAGAPFMPIAEGFQGFWVDLQCGALDAALARLRSAVAALERDDPFGRLPYLIGMVGSVHDERGEDDAALAAMARAERLAEETVLGGYIADVAARLTAGVHARTGRLAEAERELGRTAGHGLGWYAGDADITRATIALERGDQGAAREGVRAALAAGALEPWRARWRNTALLAPLLAGAGRSAWARELVEDALAARPPLASCARLLALRAWLRGLEGDERGMLDDVASAWAEAGEAPEHLLRRERPRLEPLLWIALERWVLEPDAVLAAIAAVAPGGGAELPYTRHPRAPVRRAAVTALATSGHPDAGARVAELEHDPDPGVAAAARAARSHALQRPAPLAFTMLGGFSLRRGSFAVDDRAWGPRRRAAQRLVRLLLLAGAAAVSEDALFEAFWPDKAEPAARRSLQVTASSARAVLDPSGAERSVLTVSDRTYRLVLSGRDSVDADTFEREAVAALAASGRDRRARLQAASERWDGEPLPEDRFEDWAAAWRARLLDTYARLLGALADACADDGDHAGAVDASRRQVALDPLDEAAQRRLMLAYARSGRRGHALRQYLACRRALIDALGVEPAQATTELQRAILAGGPL